MGQNSQNQRLCDITTLWTLLAHAREGTHAEAQAAQAQLLIRYGGAIRRYLNASARDPVAADDLYQEFALRLLKGDLRNADPARGRFRDYVKTILYNMITTHYKQKHRQPGPLALEHAEPYVAPADSAEADRVFLGCWRDELLAHCWDVLAKLESEGGQPSFTVLRYRSEHPASTSAVMAEALSDRLGKPITPASVRQLVHRAREKFAESLIEQVAHSLQDPSNERLEQELIDLELFEYCRPVLRRVLKKPAP
jgi:RNA polymerase sigma factor (sigma-70 family)